MRLQQSVHFKMNAQNNNPECKCPRDDIAAYIDGELLPAEEMELENHFSSCSHCLTEFNAQKGLLSVLNCAMEEQDREIPMPDNFARTLTINAESNVAGIRSPVERYRALVVCAVLLFVASVGLGADAGLALKPFGRFADQALAIAGFAFHFLFDIGIGLGVVFRSFGQSVFQGSDIALGLSVGLFLFASAALSKIILRYNRTP